MKKEHFVSFKIPNYVMAGVYNDYFMQLLKREGMKIDNSKIDEAIAELALEGKINKLCEIVEEYSKDERLPQDNMKKFIVIYMGEKLVALEEVGE